MPQSWEIGERGFGCNTNTDNNPQRLERLNGLRNFLRQALFKQANVLYQQADSLAVGSNQKNFLPQVFIRKTGTNPKDGEQVEVGDRS